MKLYTTAIVLLPAAPVGIASAERPPNMTCLMRKFVALAMFSLVYIATGAVFSAHAKDSCASTAQKVQRVLDRNPQPSIEDIEPLVADEETLALYCNRDALAVRLQAAEKEAVARAPRIADPAGRVAQVAEDNFGAVVAHSSRPVVVVFMTDMCASCWKVVSSFAALDAQLGGAVRFARLDTIANERFSRRFYLLTRPTVIVFKNGKESARHEGEFGHNDLAEWVRTAGELSPLPDLSGSRVATATDATFNRLVAGSNVPVVVFAMAAWCGPCRMMTAGLEALQAEMQGRVQFATLNVDADPKTPAKLAVMNIPTFVIFRDGKEISRHVGALSKDRLSEWINQSLGG